MGSSGSGTARALVSLTAALLLAACSGGSDPPATSGPTEGPATGAVTGDATEVPDPVPTTLPGPGGEGSDGTDGSAGTAGPDGTEGTATTGGPASTEGPDAGEGPGTERTVLTRLEFEIPADWEVEDMGDAEAADPQAGQIPPHLWCLVPPTGLPPIDGCAGVVVAIGGDWLPGAGGSPYRHNQEGAWWSGSGEPACPFGQGAEDEGEAEDAGEGEDGDQGEAEPTDVAVTDNDGLPLTSTSTQVGEYVARYETWRVTCQEGGETFTPQLWHLPELNVLVKDYYGHPDTVAVLHGLEGA